MGWQLIFFTGKCKWVSGGVEKRKSVIMASTINYFTTTNLLSVKYCSTREDIPNTL